MQLLHILMQVLMDELFTIKFQILKQLKYETIIPIVDAKKMIQENMIPESLANDLKLSKASFFVVNSS